MLLTDASECVDQHQGRGALHRVGLHGPRQWVVVRRLVDRDREGQAVFVCKHAQCRRCHHVVVFEYAVQSDYRQRLRVEGALNLDRLRQTVGDAAGAKHLEGVEDHDTALQLRKPERLRCVEPL